MEQPMIISLIVLTWIFFIFLNVTWVGALKEKRGWFKSEDDGSGFVAIVIFAPITFILLLIATYAPPLSTWLRTKIEKVI